MSSAAPHEGRDHDTLLPGAAAVAVLVVLALAAQFSPQPATAQSTPCTAIQDDAERLACYDRALRAASPAAPTAAAPAAQAPTVPAPAADVQTPAAQLPSAQSPSAQSPSAQSPPAQSPPAQSPPAQSPPAQSPAQQGTDKAILPVVIVGVRTLQGRETLFTAQDGTIWVQTDSQRVVGLPATPFDAEIKPGAMSSQFLVPKNGARAIRVRQAER